MATEKSGVGAAGIRRREAVVPSEGLVLGDVRPKPISMNRDRTSTNRPFARERRAGVAGAPKLGCGTTGRIDGCQLRRHKA